MSILLENERVKLTGLKFSDWEILWPIARQIDLHAFGSNDISTIEKLKAYIKTALEEAAIGIAIPFVIHNKETNEVVGCTRFGHIDSKNKVLHIGWTWISMKMRGTGFNHEMKYLMLNHAFNTLEFEKVEFRIDERNRASRKAVEKLGATLEGILRKNMIVKDEFRRSTCCYGILREEWPYLKASKFQNLKDI